MLTHLCPFMPLRDTLPFGRSGRLFSFRRLHTGAEILPQGPPRRSISTPMSDFDISLAPPKTDTFLTSQFSGMSTTSPITCGINGYSVALNSSFLLT